MASKETLGRIRHTGLVTQQRRLRHLHSVSARNIVPKFPLSGDSLVACLLETCFSLHSHDDDQEAIYTSDKITYSLNPTWASFELNTANDWSQTSSTLFVVRLWGGHDTNFSLIIEWRVDLTSLQYLGDQIRTSNHPPNTLIFGIVDGYYGAPLNNTIPKVVSEPQQPFSISIKVDTEQVVPSYNKASLERLCSLQRAIRQTQISVLEYQQSIENSLLTTEKSMLQLTKRESLKLKLKLLREELATKNAVIRKEREDEKKMLNTIRKREHNLARKRTEFEEKNLLLREHKQAHVSKRESLVKLNAQLNMRKRQLACELTYIYPIVQADSKDFIICGVRLPNSESEEFFATDDDTLSCSLGYACHLVYMIGKILEVPQRYAMNPMGSRSTIMDYTIEKVPEKDKEFPLHTKGKEKIQFYYGIFLLNKNIAQLRQYCNLGTPNLRNTLPNIKDTLEIKFRASTEPIKPSITDQPSITPSSRGSPMKPITESNVVTSRSEKKPPLMPKPINIQSKPVISQTTNRSSPNSSPSKPPLPPKPLSMRQGTTHTTLSDHENELLNVVNYDFVNDQDVPPPQTSLTTETVSTNIENNGTIQKSTDSVIKPATQGAPHRFFERRSSKKNSKSFSSGDASSQISETKNDTWSEKRKSLHDLRGVPVEVMRGMVAVNSKLGRSISELDPKPVASVASNSQESGLTEQSTDSQKPSLQKQPLDNGIDGRTSTDSAKTDFL